MRPSPSVLPIHDANTLLIFATVVSVGIASGTIAKRLRLPSITGQIVAGVAIGSSGIGLFEHHAIDKLAPVTQFALSLMAVTVGAHLNFRKLRNAGRRLSLLVLCEAILIPAFVFIGLSPFERVDWTLGLLFGALAISTAPATVVALVRETHARGVFVNTLVAGVALNNMACIVLFEVARFLARSQLGPAEVPLEQVGSEVVWQVLQAAAIGSGTALLVRLFARLSQDPRWFATKGLIAILITSGLAGYVHVSPLLACLFLGLAQVNLTRDRDRIIDVPFSDFEPVILAAFFTIAGMELTLDYAWQAGGVALVFFATRIAGKLGAGWLSMTLAAAPQRLRSHLGMALVPQAGVAVGLVVLLEDDPLFLQNAPEMVKLFAAVVLTVVVGNEIVGPILTRFGLTQSGEAGGARNRLFDFIQEDNIIVNMTGKDPQDAIRQLCDVLARSQGLNAAARDSLLESTLERESEMSTCFGEGLAVPHGTLEGGGEVCGVMGLSSEGLDFETPDGRPVHCMVLLATPPDKRDRHLEILAALAKTVGSDHEVQGLLYGAKSAAHAYEILTSDTAEDLNYFLEPAASER